MLQRQQFEQRSFEAAVEDELRVLGPTPPPPLRISDIPDVERRASCQLAPPLLAGRSPILLGSCILPFVRMWTEALGADRLMIVESSYLLHDREAALDSVFAHLGLPPAKIADFSDQNVGEYSPIDPSTDARLREWFAPLEAALDEFLATHPARIPAL